MLATQEHFDRAIELNPNDAVSHFMLGRWCYEVGYKFYLSCKTNYHGKL